MHENIIQSTLFCRKPKGIFQPSSIQNGATQYWEWNIWLHQGCSNVGTVHDVLRSHTKQIRLYIQPNPGNKKTNNY